MSISKKANLVIAAVAVLFIAFAFVSATEETDAVPADETINEVVYRFYDSGTEKTAEVIGCTVASPKEITIPETVTASDTEVYTVTIIRNFAFQDKPVTGIFIPKTVYDVNSYTFGKCRDLLSITVDGNSEYYSSADGILYNKNGTVLLACPGGKTGTAYIPRDVADVHSAAFAYGSLTGIEADPDNGKYHTDGGVLYEGTTLVAYPGGKAGPAAIPDGVEEIGNGAFRGSSVTAVSATSSLTRVLPFAFCGSSVTDINLPSVSTIREYTFWDCVSLTGADIPSATFVGTYAFRGCTKLASVTMPVAADIDFGAFDSCTNLSSVDFPEAKTIGTDAFVGCTLLGSISLPEATSVGSHAFFGCTKLTSADLPKATTIDDNAFNDCTLLGSISMPEATSVGSHAFFGCTSLPSADLPKATTVGDYAFYRCTLLSSISMPEATIIGNYAFDGCTGLPSVDMPRVTTIGSHAFGGCSSLSSVSVPQVTAVGSYAFRETALSSVNLPFVTTLEEGIFYNCSALRSVNAPNVKNVGLNAFCSCTDIELTFSNGGEIHSKALIHAKVKKLILVNVENGKIGGLDIDWGFAGANSIKEIMFDSDNTAPDVSKLNAIPPMVGKLVSFSYGTPNPVSGDDMKDTSGNPITDRNGFTFESSDVSGSMRWTNVSGSSKSVTVPALPCYVYDGTDKTVAAKAGYALSGETTGRNAKEDYTVTATLNPGLKWDDGTTGDKTLTWAILRVHVMTSSAFAVDPLQAQEYSGTQLTPTVTVKENGVPLGGTHYIVSYGANLDAGDNAGSVTIEGLINYVGSVTINFTITPKDVSTLDVSEVSDKTYTGSAIEPSVEVKHGTIPLVEDRDYTIGYASNLYVGEAGIIIEGRGNYTGSKTVHFQILPKKVTVTPDSGKSKVYGESDPHFSFVLSESNFYSYSGSLTKGLNENVGVYEITIGTLTSTDNNYVLELSSTPVTFEITKKTVTVTPHSGQSKVYSGTATTDPSLDYDSEGLVSPDTFTSGALGRETGENVGFYTIELGNLSAGDNYNVVLASTPVKFEITKKTVTVTPHSGQSKVYSGTATTDPSLDYGSEGLVSPDTFTSGALGRETGENVGFYTIELGNLSAGDNYNVVLASTPVKFEITKKTVTVTPHSGQTKVYGTDNSVLTYTVSGLVGDDGMTGTLSLSEENVGTRTITLGTLSAGGNYDTVLSTPAVTVEITKATVTVTPKSGQSKVFGESDPDSFTFDLSEAVAYTGNLARNGGENAGEYDITIGTLESDSPNHVLELSATVVKFVIAKKPVTVTPESGQSKVFGESDPDSFTFDLSEAVAYTGNLARNGGENAGEYDITIGTLESDSPNHVLEISPTAVKFVITKKPVTVTPESGQSKVFGEPDPVSLTFDLSEAVAYTGNLARNGGENAGEYDITIGTLESDSLNHVLEISPTAVKFIIVKKQVTVTPGPNQSKVYGTPDPEITYTLSIAVSVNGELSRESGEEVGNYGITIGTLKPNSDNYRLILSSEVFAIKDSAIRLEINTDIPSEQEYDGQPVTGNITVKASGTTLVPETDYGVTYENNTNAGTAKVYITGKGEYAGSGGYYAFTILRKTATVIPDSGQTKVYGTDNSALGYTVTGLIGEVGMTGTLSVSGENVGTRMITLGTLSAGDNYNTVLSATEVTLEITRATATVTPDSGQTKVYGTDNSALGYTVTGLIGEDGMTGTLSVSEENVGTRTITLGTLSAGDNYNTVLSATEVTLEITKATVTVTPKSGQTKVYGTEDPSLKYTSAGLVGTDEMAGSLTRAPGNGVGAYLIKVGTLTGGDNYDLIFDSTAVYFEITKATVTVTPNPGQSKVYGTEDPVLEYTVTGLVGTDAMTGSLARASGEEVGSYAITLGTLSAGDNYDTVMDVAEATFEITPVPASSSTGLYIGAAVVIVAVAAGAGVFFFLRMRP